MANEAGGDGSATPSGREAHGLDEELVELVDELAVALLRRERTRARTLLRGRLATRLPRSVREEALAILSSPADALRAPIEALRYAHRMRELLRPSRVVRAPESAARS